MAELGDHVLSWRCRTPWTTWIRAEALGQAMLGPAGIFDTRRASSTGRRTGVRKREGRHLHGVKPLGMGQHRFIEFAVGGFKPAATYIEPPSGSTPNGSSASGSFYVGRGGPIRPDGRTPVPRPTGPVNIRRYDGNCVVPRVEPQAQQQQRWLIEQHRRRSNDGTLTALRQTSRQVATFLSRNLIAAA